MAIKIQINSLAALERLIGGDSEIEMEIRDNIVNEFTKKHLRMLAKEDMIKRTAEAIKNELKTHFFEDVKVGNYGSTESRFKESVLSDLKVELLYQARLELKKLVTDAIKESVSLQKVNEYIEQQANWITETLTNENLTDRLDRLVDKKLKEKLGIK